MATNLREKESRTRRRDGAGLLLFRLAHLSLPRQFAGARAQLRVTREERDANERDGWIPARDPLCTRAHVAARSGATETFPPNFRFRKVSQVGALSQ